MKNDECVLKCLEASVKTAINTYGTGNKILIAGNGGSAADAQHLFFEHSLCACIEESLFGELRK
jgi:phosphoheptose isomerase